MMFDSEVPSGIMAFGAVIAFYAVFSILLLIAAWWKPVPVLISLMKWSALLAGSTILIGSLDAGLISGLEWVAIFVAGVLLWEQYLSVRLIVDDQMANKALQPTV